MRGFKRNRTNCQVEHRIGRPNEVKKIRKSVVDDRRLKMRKLVDKVGISKSAVHRTLSENLNIRKLYARWVPRLFTNNTTKTTSWGSLNRVFGDVSPQ